jgi:hypothetical protein
MVQTLESWLEIQLHWGRRWGITGEGGVRMRVVPNNASAPCNGSLHGSTATGQNIEIQLHWGRRWGITGKGGVPMRVVLNDATAPCNGKLPGSTAAGHMGMPSGGSQSTARQAREARHARQPRNPAGKHIRIGAQVEGPLAAAETRGVDICGLAVTFCGLRRQMRMRVRMRMRMEWGWG